MPASASGWAEDPWSFLGSWRTHKLQQIKYNLNTTIIKAAPAERVILDNLESALITPFCITSAKQIQYLFLTTFEMLIPETASVQKMFNSQLMT